MRQRCAAGPHDTHSSRRPCKRTYSCQFVHDRATHVKDCCNPSITQSAVTPAITYVTLTACRCALQSAVASDRAVRPAASPSAPRQQAPSQPPPKQGEASPPPGRKLGFRDSRASSSSGVGAQDSISGGRSPAQAAPPSPSSSAAAVNGLQARSSSGGKPSGWVTVDGAAQSDAGGPCYQAVCMSCCGHAD